jgi:hypothetical protein
MAHTATAMVMERMIQSHRIIFLTAK